MSQKSRWEYFRAIYPRYQQADRKLKQVILNEFCLNTGYHRKYAIRLLNGPPPTEIARPPDADAPAGTGRKPCPCWRRSGRRPVTPGRCA